MFVGNGQAKLAPQGNGVSGAQRSPVNEHTPWGQSHLGGRQWAGWKRFSGSFITIAFATITKITRNKHRRNLTSIIDWTATDREQVPRSCRNLESFLGYSDKLLSPTNVTGPAFYRCLFSKLGSYNALHFRSLKSNFCSRTRFWCAVAVNRNRDRPSAAIAWGKAPYEALFHQFSPSMLISSPC